MKIIGIVGAGTMGTGIAYVAAASGFSVVLNDLADDRLRDATEHVISLFKKAVQKNLVTAEAAEHSRERIRVTKQLDDLSSANIVIEAALEDLAVKKNIFLRLDDLCAEEAVLTTNTSSLSITEIASATKNPERVAGMHFFNPPHVMKLVEIVRGHLTSDSTMSALTQLARTMGKEAVVVKDTPGFIVNRVARPFYLEALRLLGEGVSSVGEIDRIMRLAGGFKMGPFELMDLIGIDVNYAVTQSVYEQFFHEPRFRPHPIQRRMVQARMLGRKTGRGFYGHPSEKA